MSSNKLVLISLAIAYVEARFGQEGLVQASISALDAFGDAGAAATLAGQTAGVLLGGAGPCDKVSCIILTR
ncbi:hypothetical protein IMZ48_43520 [Candidatus Bathyarchaeota archaeon]|nr:hypothetical protein [Candidatus Bathyarchaeota archaeon]